MQTVQRLVLLGCCWLFLLKRGLGQTDTTVNRVLKLLDPTSIRKTIGDQSKRMIEDEGPTRVQLTSKDGREYLILNQLPGSSYNSFNEFEIGVMRAPRKSFRPGSFGSFFTESGIHLGMTLDSLVRIKGASFSKSVKNGQTILTYKLGQRDKGSAILRRYNMPEYRAVYYFVDSRLVRFIFGFPNP